MNHQIALKPTCERLRFTELILGTHFSLLLVLQRLFSALACHVRPLISLEIFRRSSFKARVAGTQDFLSLISIFKLAASLVQRFVVSIFPSRRVLSSPGMRSRLQGLSSALRHCHASSVFRS